MISSAKQKARSAPGFLLQTQGGQTGRQSRPVPSRSESEDTNVYRKNKPLPEKTENIFGVSARSPPSPKRGFPKHVGAELFRKTISNNRDFFLLIFRDFKQVLNFFCAQTPMNP